MKQTFVLVAIVFVAAFGFAQSQSVAAASQATAASAPASAGDVTNGPVAEYISANAAVVGWSTRYPGKGSIKYGTDAKNLNQSAEVQQTNEGRNHHARLTNLKPDTNYFFQVMQNGRPAEEMGIFRTVAAGSKPERSKAVIPQ